MDLLVLVVSMYGMFCFQDESSALMFKIQDWAPAIMHGADMSPLPSGVLIRFQEIRLQGETAGSNYQFLLLEDGRFFMQENTSGDADKVDASAPAFRQPLPNQPTCIIPPKGIKAIISVLEEQAFFELDSVWKPESKVFDGSIQMMECVKDPGTKPNPTKSSSTKSNSTKTICSYQGACQPLEAILEVIWQWVYRK